MRIEVSQYEASPRPGARLSRARAHEAAPASGVEQRFVALARCIPIAILVLAAVAGLAWHEHGSPNSQDWLKYGLLAGVVIVGILVSNRATRMRPPAVLAVSALGGIAILATISITYSPVPNLARDEALLTLFYAAVFAVPALMLRTREDRTAATGLVAAGGAGLAVCAALALVTRSHPEYLFYGGRLNFPITYPNGQAAAMLIGFWPAVALASRRSRAVWLRALALGGATATLCGWLLTQSKGGAIGLIASAVVVFAVSQRRLRLVVPFGIASILAAFGAVPLTAPIRATTTPALRSAIHHGGKVLLLLTVAGIAAGAVYGLIDKRLELSGGTRTMLGRIALIATVVALIGGPGYFFATVEGPGPFLTHQWHAFKSPPKTDTETHLLTLGSNRYDFWRVALTEFAHHPILGIGSRGFGPAYLQLGKSQETPARAHSLPFDTLAELGLAGFILLVLGFAPPFAAVVRRARTEVTAAGVLAGCVYFVAHACVDWIWTIPAVGVLAMLLLSIAAAYAPPPERSATSRRATLAVALAVFLVSLIAFVPPWLAANYAQRAAKGGIGLQNDIDKAKLLDPLSIEPYVAQARWSGTLQNALVPLHQAVDLQPRSVAARYLYGIDLLKVGQLAEAHDQLYIAWQLSPRDPYVNAALKLAPFSRPPR
jgi:O-antigen ligase